MKIVFLCSSLEAGRDGVGDYTRRLAGQLIRQGHEIRAFALNDNFIFKINEKVQYFENIELPVLRMPAVMDAKQKYSYLKKHIENFEPDLISLQYVGFGFNKYGLPIDMLFLLRPAIANKKLHIMFHELWCGMSDQAGKKEKLLGVFQRFFLKLISNRLKPATVFTSIDTYASYLKQIDISARVVPIFGNIPVDETVNSRDWLTLSQNAGFTPLLTDPEEWLIIGFFGTIYNRFAFEHIIELAADAAKNEGLKFGVVTIGHTRGMDIKELVSKIENAAYWHTGALPAGLINSAMGLINLGVVTSPVDGIDKSGSAVAWMERGIPILISAEDKTYHPEMEDKGIYQVNSIEDVINAFNSRNNLAPQSRLSSVADAYLLS